MAKLSISRAQRLDQKVVELMPRLSRAFAVQVIEEGKVLVNGRPMIKPGYKLHANDVVTSTYDIAELEVIPDIELPVLYEDADCVVINKPIGVLSHSKGVFNPEATIASWLSQRVHGLAGQRAGIVHRLDRATSGVMIGAKTPDALGWLQKQFSQRRTKKTYYAVVAGAMPHDHAIIDMPLERDPKKPQTFRVNNNGKSALTEYWVRGSNDRYSLVELRPQTGRTHQLRVHLRAVGHPIVGDAMYGGEPADRLYLHAEQLEITTPDHQRRTFEAPLPSEFRAMIKE